jgi:hypothetical protein
MTTSKPVTERRVRALCARVGRVMDSTGRSLAQPRLGRGKRIKLRAIQREGLSILHEIAARYPVGSLPD